MPRTRAQSLEIACDKALPEFNWEAPPFEFRENFGNIQRFTIRLFVTPEHPQNLKTEVQQGSPGMPPEKRLRLEPQPVSFCLYKSVGSYAQTPSHVIRVSGEKNRIASSQKSRVTGAVKGKGIRIDSICLSIRHTEYGKVMTRVELALKLCFERFSLKCIKFDDYVLALPIPIAYNVVGGHDVDLIVFSAHDNPCSIARPVGKFGFDSHD